MVVSGADRNPRSEIVEILALADVPARLAELGYDLVANTVEQFGVRIRAQIELWAKVIRAVGIKAE